MDDLANNWGLTYVLPDKAQMPSKRKSIDAFTYSHGQYETQLRRIITEMTQGYFSLEKVTPNGSDANLFAVTSLSNADSNTVLLGCGSYVSGDLGPLQTWSTAAFRVEEGPSYIYTPDSKDVSPAARNRNVPLPYCIQGMMNTENQRSYERICLNLLHKRCCFQRTIEKPITALFLELLLASNGSTLSDHFLECLASLSKHHDFGIIVDEILTGARTTSFLMTMAKPQVFVDQVSYVTLGKWCKCGIVLSGQSQDYRLHETKSLLDPRGVTTALNCSIPLPYFRKARELLSTIPQRRQKSISRFPSLEEKDTWGEGLIIFIPRRCTATRTGTKNRLLPLLNDTPFDIVPNIQEDRWSRLLVSDNTVKSVLCWTRYPVFLHDQFDLDSTLMLIYQMISHLMDQQYPDGWATTKDLHTHVTSSLQDQEKVSIRTTAKILRCLEKAGYIRKGMKTTRRLHGWYMEHQNLNYPGHFLETE